MVIFCLQGLNSIHFSENHLRADFQLTISVFHTTIEFHPKLVAKTEKLILLPFLLFPPEIELSCLAAVSSETVNTTNSTRKIMRKNVCDFALAMPMQLQINCNVPVICHHMTVPS